MIGLFFLEQTIRNMIPRSNTRKHRAFSSGSVKGLIAKAASSQHRQICKDLLEEHIAGHLGPLQLPAHAIYYRPSGLLT